VGLLAKWAADGCVVHHWCAPTVRRGPGTPTSDVAALAERRQDEQREAPVDCAGANAGEVRFLGRVDGELDSDLETQGEWPHHP
jgi:hypothetical protein